MGIEGRINIEDKSKQAPVKTCTPKLEICELCFDCFDIPEVLHPLLFPFAGGIGLIAGKLQGGKSNLLGYLAWKFRMLKFPVIYVVGAEEVPPIVWRRLSLYDAELNVFKEDFLMLDEQTSLKKIQKIAIEYGWNYYITLVDSGRLPLEIQSALFTTHKYLQQYTALDRIVKEHLWNPVCNLFLVLHLYPGVVEELEKVRNIEDINWDLLFKGIAGGLALKAIAVSKCVIKDFGREDLKVVFIQNRVPVPSKIYLQYAYTKYGAKVQPIEGTFIVDLDLEWLREPRRQAILEYLVKHKKATPSQIARALGFPPSTVKTILADSRRAKTLTSLGAVKPLKDGTYEITKEGEELWGLLK